MNQHPGRDNAFLANASADNFLGALPSNLVKLVLTSPPYNLGKPYENTVGLFEYMAAQERIIEQLCRVLRSDGSICWQVGNYVQDGEVFPLDILFYEIFKRQGLYLRNRIIWHFGHGLHASKRFSGRYETIMWFTKSDAYTFDLDSVRVPSKYPGKRHYKGPKKGQLSGNPKGKNPSDVWQEFSLREEWDEAVWDIPNVKANHIEKTLHPCQFPVELAERCVLALTNEEDWVLDPYAGVGSTLIAAVKWGRRAMGCDKEQRYVDIGRQRLQDLFEGKLKTRPLGKPPMPPSGKAAQMPKTEEVAILCDEDDYINYPCGCTPNQVGCLRRGCRGEWA